MKKLLPLFSLLLMFGCEGPEGPAGPAGADGANGDDGDDGVANIHTEIIEMTINNTEYVANPGYLQYTLTSNLVTQAVVDSGLVVVEVSPSNNPYTWYSLPYIVYDGDNNDVNWMITCEYAYTLGSVGISWWSSEYFEESEWLEIAPLWASYYKISIITPN